MWRTAVVAVVLTAATAAQSKFTLKVHTGKGQIGYDVNSTMIIGERDMLLIDPQFSLREAHKLAAEILETKKHLATVYSTHPHPDHLFGPAVLKQAFPDAKIVALPRRHRGENGMAGSSEILGGHLRQQHSGPEPVLPEELATPVLTLKVRLPDYRRCTRRRRVPARRWSPETSSSTTSTLACRAPNRAPTDRRRSIRSPRSTPRWSCPGTRVPAQPAGK